MLILFTILVVYKLTLIKPYGQSLAQKLFDILFEDLDYSLRELGAGDIGVASRIKKMSSAYLGRQKSYCDALKNNELKDLITSLNNNVYRNVNVDQKKIKLLALFCFQTVKKLNTYTEKDFLSGRVHRLNKTNKQKAIFLDRDGVINQESDRIDNIEKSITNSILDTRCQAAIIVFYFL